MTFSTPRPIRMIRPLVLSLFVLTAGCTETPGLYPSLSKRAIESRPDAEPEAPAPAPAKPDAALDAQVKALNDRLAQADSGFSEAAARTERAARAPGSQSIGSDSWVGAQTALSDLESQRGDTLSVLTDFERLVTDRGVSGDVPYPSLDDGRAKAQAQLDAETKQITAIKALLGEK